MHWRFRVFSAKTIDIEVWLPSQNCFREISLVQILETFNQEELMQG